MKIRDRIKDFRRVKASDLSPNPRNWRTHPKAQQDALKGILAEIGYADALLARELPDGGLELVDGHLRAETTPDMEVPVLVLDLDQDEAEKLVTVLDPMAAMAETNKDALGSLLQQMQTDNDGLQAMLEELASSEGIDVDIDEAAKSGQVSLSKIEIQQPPKMTWALVGIPTVRYNEIAEQVDRISSVRDVVLEMTANDG